MFAVEGDVEWEFEYRVVGGEVGRPEEGFASEFDCGGEESESCEEDWHLEE